MLSKARTLSISLIALLASASASAIELERTVWAETAMAHDIDPMLLYAIALVESQQFRDTDETMIQPWPYAINDGGQSYYFKDRSTAVAYIEDQPERLDSMDLGLMQINWRWHGGRVESPEELLTLETSLDVASEILSESLASSPDDLVLGVGRYHTWEDTARARRYGQRVLGVYYEINRYQWEVKDGH
jgi:hypothetical protein